MLRVAKSRAETLSKQPKSMLQLWALHKFPPHTYTKLTTKGNKSTKAGGKARGVRKRS